MSTAVRDRVVSSDGGQLLGHLIDDVRGRTAMLQIDVTTRERRVFLGYRSQQTSERGAPRCGVPILHPMRGGRDHLESQRTPGEHTAGQCLHQSENGVEVDGCVSGRCDRANGMEIDDALEIEADFPQLAPKPAKIVRTLRVHSILRRRLADELRAGEDAGAVPSSGAPPCCHVIE